MAISINDYVRKLSPEETIDAFVVVFAALSTDSLAVAVGELTWDEREQLREALEAAEEGDA